MYADSNYVYKDVGKLLKNGCHVVFIGLPCQVAAMKNYVNIDNIDENTPMGEYRIVKNINGKEYINEFSLHPAGV